MIAAPAAVAVGILPGGSGAPVLLNLLVSGEEALVALTLIAGLVRAAFFKELNGLLYHLLSQ